MYSRTAADDDAGLLEELAAHGVQVQRMALPGFRTPWALWRSQRLVREWRAQMRAQCPDVIHTFLPSANLLALIASPGRMDERGKPLPAEPAPSPAIVISQAALGNYRRRARLLRLLEDALYPRAGAILCNSEAVRADLRLNIPRLASERCEVVYNGIEMDAEPPTSAARSAARSELLGVGADETVLLLVANLIPYKGQDLAIQALDMLPRSLKPLLVLVGDDPHGWRSHLETLARRMGLPDRVRFAGQQRHLAPWYAAADVLVSASHEEGFSNSVIEGMAAGLPIVATRVGGTPEAVGDDYPYLVESRRTEDLAATIARLLKDRTAARTLGLDLASRARAKFSLGAMCSGVLDVYHNALDRRD